MKLRERRPVSLLERARKRFEASKVAQRITRIGFLVDATGSRQATWEQAQRIQANMFEAVTGLQKLELRLVHFGGARITDYGWSKDPGKLAAKMARVRCEKGYTQINEGLKAFLDEGPEVDAIILVGDSCEEEMDVAVATELKRRGIKMFCFLEGHYGYAVEIFGWLAYQTGGKFAHFGDDLPLGDLCEGVALLAAGGEKALARSKNEEVKRLLLAGPED